MSHCQIDYGHQAAAVRRENTALLELTCPSLSAWRFILHEPTAIDVDLVLEQIFSSIYPKPYVIETLESRALYFSMGYVQSVMRFADPTALVLAYTRAMTGFLLFRPNPRKVLLLGLGGGSLAKWCYRNLPSCVVTSVELDMGVLAFRDQFHIPADDDRFRVINEDAAKFVAAPDGGLFDVILQDAFDRQGIAASVCSLEFYENVRARLTPNGILVANLWEGQAESRAHFQMLKKVFRGKVVATQASPNGNHVAFAFRNSDLDRVAISEQARLLGVRFSVDFPSLANQLIQHRTLEDCSVEAPL